MTLPNLTWPVKSCISCFFLQCYIHTSYYYHYSCKALFTLIFAVLCLHNDLLYLLLFVFLRSDFCWLRSSIFNSRLIIIRSDVSYLQGRHQFSENLSITFIFTCYFLQVFYVVSNILDEKEFNLMFSPHLSQCDFIHYTMIVVAYLLWY